MLYLLQNTIASSIRPMRQSLRIVRATLNSAANPFINTELHKSNLAWLDVIEQLSGAHLKPEWGIHETEINGGAVKIEDEIVLKRTYCQLVHFKKVATKLHQPKLLIVAPYSGHFATLLRGTVEAMLPEHDVYITDWLDCKNIPTNQDRFNLNDFIDYLIDFLHFLGPKTHVLAVCQPTVAALATTAIMSDWGDRCQPCSLTLIAGPIDTRVNPTKVNEFAKSHDLEWFEKNLIQPVPPPFLGMGRRVYPGFLQLNSFMAMNSERHAISIDAMHEALVRGNEEEAHRRKAFYDEYLSVMDLTEEFYLQTIKEVFQEHSLPQGKMMSRWHQVDTKHIRKSYLMVIEGEEDDICGVGQTKAAFDITPNLPEKHKRYELIQGVGHYGTFNGAVFRRTIAPMITQFIQDADQHHEVTISPSQVTTTGDQS